MQGRSSRWEPEVGFLRLGWSSVISNAIFQLSLRVLTMKDSTITWGREGRGRSWRRKKCNEDFWMLSLSREGSGSGIDALEM